MTPAPTAAPGEPRWNVVAWAAAMACVVVLGFAAWLFVRESASDPLPWMNHDVAFLTWAGSELLAGERLYVGFEEMNPPGAHFLHAAILAVGRPLGLSDVLATHLAVLALGLAGLAILRAVFAGEDDGRTFTLVALAYVLVVVRVNFSNNVVPSDPGIPYDFGQREHLFALAFVPWVLGRSADRLRGWRWAPLALVVGFVAAFKPYTLALVVLVEAVRAWRVREPETAERVPLAAGVLAPYAILLVHSPEGFARFWTDVVPLMLSGGYAAYGMDAGAFLTSTLHLQMVLAGVLFLALWGACTAGRRIERGTAWIYLGVVALAYANVVVQGKWWSYHGVVYFATVIPFTAVLASRGIAAVRDARLRLLATAAVLVVLVAAVGAGVRSLARMLAFHTAKDAALVGLIGEAEPVMFFSTGANYAYAPLVLGTDVVGPWREHFRVPALLAVEDPAERRRGLDRYAAAIRARIVEARPRLLLFSPLSVGLPPGVHLHDILSAHGAIPTEGYRRIDGPTTTGRDPRLAGWIVYERIDRHAGGGGGG